MSLNKILREAAEFVEDGIVRDFETLCCDIVKVHGPSSMDPENVAAFLGSAALDDPGYELMAGKILLDHHLKKVPRSFYEVAASASLVSDRFRKIVSAHAARLDALCSAAAKKLKWTYCSASMIIKTYLLRDSERRVCERPEHMLMRCALAAATSPSRFDIDLAEKCFDSLVKGEISFPSPVMFRSCTVAQQTASCFVLEMGDSMDSIVDCIAKFTKVSQNGGGLGISFSQVRPAGSLIRSVHGSASGIVPIAQQFNNLGKFVNQGGKRPGAVAIYLEPWHEQVFDLLNLRGDRGGLEDTKARDVHVGLWMPELFFERLAANAQWSLMNPDSCPGLTETFGSEFNELYEEYEREGKATRTITARELWSAIMTTQIETGEPFLLNKDAANEKNVNADLGAIKSPNLCTEILQYTDTETPGVCILGTICLNKLVSPDGKQFNVVKLSQLAKDMVVYLNNLIDTNTYPFPEAEKVCKTMRPLGIGVQGFGDMLVSIGKSFESEAARRINRHIFETIYLAALNKSINLGKDEPERFQKRFRNFCPDLYDSKLTSTARSVRHYAMNYGAVNSLLTALPPTASTAKICNNSESVDPVIAVSLRRLLSGEFLTVNSSLSKMLWKRCLQRAEDDYAEFFNRKESDSEDERLECVHAMALRSYKAHMHAISDASDVKASDLLTDGERGLFKSIWDVDQKHVLDMARDRSPYVDQGQSTSLYVPTNRTSKLHEVLMHAVDLRLKNINYYVHCKRLVKPMSCLRSGKNAVTPNPSWNANRNPNNECSSCSA